jgi:hypothetical protein
MAGFKVAVNGKQLAAVASDGFNIITVQVHGDVKGDELATVDVFGGLYEGKQSDSHLLWVHDHEIKAGEEIEIIFCENIDTSHRGKAIEELHPEVEPEIGPQQSMEELFSDLATMPKRRERFAFELVPPNGEVFHSSTDPEEYGFHLSAMWRWVKPDEARVSLTSNSLDGIKRQESGRKHAGFIMQYGQGVKFRVGT